jgi:hypothetical protein
MTVTEDLVPVPDLDDLPPMPVAGRLDALRARLDGAGCDALVVSDLTNIRYLTGFTGSAAVLLVGAGAAVFVTDGRYRDQSADQLAAAGVDADLRIVPAEPDAAVADAARGWGVARLGLEADAVTWAAQRRWSGELFSTGELVPTTGVVGALRLVKDHAEVARIRAACDSRSCRPRPTSRPSWTPPCATWARPTSASRRSWRPAPTAPSRTTVRPVGGSRRVIWWSSTSGRWSTATTPT